jgi:hypothetical protein
VGEYEADMDDIGEILYHLEDIKDMEATRPMEGMAVMVISHLLIPINPNNTLLCKTF